MFCHGYCCHWQLLWVAVCGMYATGVYSAESVTDCSWLCVSLGLIFVYHFVILQGLGLVTFTAAFILLWYCVVSIIIILETWYTLLIVSYNSVVRHVEDHRCRLTWPLGCTDVAWEMKKHCSMMLFWEKILHLLKLSTHYVSADIVRWRDRRVNMMGRHYGPTWWVVCNNLDRCNAVGWVMRRSFCQSVMLWGPA